MAKAFSVIGTLEEIQLPQNGIQHEGIAALAEAVKVNKNLSHLNLNDNIFTEKGAVSMAKGIAEIDSLTIINFGDCLVRTKGAKAIAEALKTSNPNLKQLILSFGEVELEGGLRVCEAVAKKEGLELVDLNGNQFGEDGVDELKDLSREFHCSDVLASLSDDEGCSSDSDDDDSNAEHDESKEHDVSGMMNGSSEVATSPVHDASMTSVLNAENFLALVTPDAMVALSDQQRLELFEDVAELVPNAEATSKALTKISGMTFLLVVVLRSILVQWLD